MNFLKYFFALAALLVSILLPSCYYDKADLLYPNSNTVCDSTGVISYSAKVAPILTANCYSCHIANQGGIAMGTYATDKIIATNGKLNGSINHISGFSPMPKSASKMSTCNLAIIKKWIAAGSPNN
jgi:hypothetical protein